MFLNFLAFTNYFLIFLKKKQNIYPNSGIIVCFIKNIKHKGWGKKTQAFENIHFLDERLHSLLFMDLQK